MKPVAIGLAVAFSAILAPLALAQNNPPAPKITDIDRKSTRLNSSH